MTPDRRRRSAEALAEAVLGEDAAFVAPASALLLRSAVHGNAQFTELLPGTSCEDGVAALVRY